MWPIAINNAILIIDVFSASRSCSEWGGLFESTDHDVLPLPTVKGATSLVKGDCANAIYLC